MRLLAKIFIRAVRYEDLLHSNEYTKKVMNFLQLGIQQSMRDFLYDNLNADIKYDRWKKEMTFEEISLIQDQCKNALNLWG